MSSSHLPVLLDTVVMQLHGELQGYETHVRQLAQEWHTHCDLVLFGEAGRAMDRMRTLAIAVPQLSATWLMVMISHTELMHNLWRVSKGEPLDTAAELDDHLSCVRAMASQCRRLLSQGGRSLH